MALSSARQKSAVDPGKGKFVEMEGVMEVRYVSDDIDYFRPPEDMFLFQDRVPHIPDDFCQKNKRTTEQAIFFCLVCNCELKNLRPLKEHINGTKHIRKAFENKRQVLGLPKEPQNAPRKKEKKTERPRVDLRERLKDRLMVSGIPAIGLDYIKEFINPRGSRDYPMYTCFLDGCKSAWGTSDDIFHHVQNAKHQRNFFKKMYPEDARISGLTKDEILSQASKYEQERGGPEERDYRQIIVVEDAEKYNELRDRPKDWSEKKSNLGLVRASCNSNNEPLGRKRKAPSSGFPQFDDSEWALEKKTDGENITMKLLKRKRPHDESEIIDLNKETEETEQHSSKKYKVSSSSANQAQAVAPTSSECQRWIQMGWKPGKKHGIATAPASSPSASLKYPKSQKAAAPSAPPAPAPQSFPDFPSADVFSHPSEHFRQKFQPDPDNFHSVADSLCVPVDEMEAVRLAGNWLRLTADITRLFNSSQQERRLLDRKIFLWKKLLETLHQEMECGLAVSGSTFNGFGGSGADLDMCLYPHGPALSDQHWLSMARTLLRKKCKSFIRGDIQLIKAKVPILKFYDFEGRLEVDLSVNNPTR